jgi:hypothetical protein
MTSNFDTLCRDMGLDFMRSIAGKFDIVKTVMAESTSAEDFQAKIRQFIVNEKRRKLEKLIKVTLENYSHVSYIKTLCDHIEYTTLVGEDAEKGYCFFELSVNLTGGEFIKFNVVKLNTDSDNYRITEHYIRTKYQRRIEQSDTTNLLAEMNGIMEMMDIKDVDPHEFYRTIVGVVFDYYENEVKFWEHPFTYYDKLGKLFLKY